MRDFGPRTRTLRGGRNSSYGSNNDDRRMYDATCANCGNDCQVPFKPTGEKPVLCNNCFRKGDDNRSNYRNDRGDRGDRRENRGPNLEAQLKEINEKLDRLLESAE